MISLSITRPLPKWLSGVLMLSRFVLVGLFALWALDARSAEPAPKARPTQKAEDVMTQARRLCDRAQELRRAGQFAAALSAYQHAYSLIPTPVILVGEAEIYRDAGRPAEALALLTRVEPNTLPQTRRRDLYRLREELAAHITRTSLALPLSNAAPPQSPPAHLPARPPRLDSAHRYRAAKWFVGGAALLAAIIGTGLLTTHDTPARTAGIVTLSAGATALGTAAFLFYLDARPEQHPFYDSTLTLVARF